MDPRIPLSPVELQAQLDALLALQDATSRVNAVIDQSEDLITQLTTLRETLRRTVATSGRAPQVGAGPAVEQALTELRALRSRLTRAGSMGYREPPQLRERIQSVAAGIGGAAAAPTDPQEVRVRELTAEVAAVTAEMNEIVKRRIPQLNALVGDNPRLVAEPIR
jgi:predicted RNA-binding Zn ribbon-like protein